MTLWVVLALMTVAAVLAVLWPLTRAERARRSGSDLVVYRDQLDEIARDRSAGLIGESEAEAAQVEVSRRLLAAADAEAAMPVVAPAAGRRRMVAATALVLVPVGACALYLVLGSPGLPGQPLAGRVEAQTQSVDTAIARIEQRLREDPSDGRGWEVIAPVYLRLGRFADAVKARRNALALNGETAERQFGLGEALFMAANSVVTPEAKAAFERAVKLDPRNVRARYFMAVLAEQEDRPGDAATILRDMLAGAPPDAPWAEYIRAELVRLEAAPGVPEIPAGADFVPDPRQMVARLAERLKQDSSDFEGWLRLVRSYKVLGERDKARAAVGDARRAVATDPDKLRRIDDLVKELGLEG